MIECVVSLPSILQGLEFPRALIICKREQRAIIEETLQGHQQCKPSKKERGKTRNMISFA